MIARLVKIFGVGNGRIVEHSAVAQEARAVTEPPAGWLWKWGLCSSIVLVIRMTHPVVPVT